MKTSGPFGLPFGRVDEVPLHVEDELFLRRAHLRARELQVERRVGRELEEAAGLAGRGVGGVEGEQRAGGAAGGNEEASAVEFLFALKRQKHDRAPTRFAARLALESGTGTNSPFEVESSLMGRRLPSGSMVKPPDGKNTPADYTAVPDAERRHRGRGTVRRRARAALPHARSSSSAWPVSARGSNSPSARLVAGGGRNRHVCIDLPLEGAVEPVIVKAFGRQSWLNDLRDRRRGSKARRTWLAATHLARARRRHADAGRVSGALGGRAAGRKLLHRRIPAGRRELPRGADRALPRASRRGALHGAPRAASRPACAPCTPRGSCTTTSGNAEHPPQAPRRGPLARVPGDRPQSRAHPQRARPARARARSRALRACSRISSQIFMRMYWQGAPPRELQRWEALVPVGCGACTSAAATGAIRSARRAAAGASARAAAAYPAPRDMWIWDERSAQPIAAQLRNERLRLYPASALCAQRSSRRLRAAPDVWRRYGEALGEAFRHPVELRRPRRHGAAIRRPQTLERELELLAALGRIPALVRFYHHEDAARRRFRAGLVRDVASRRPSGGDRPRAGPPRGPRPRRLARFHRRRAR